MSCFAHKHNYHSIISNYSEQLKTSVIGWLQGDDRREGVAAGHHPRAAHAQYVPGEAEQRAEPGTAGGDGAADRLGDPARAFTAILRLSLHRPVTGTPSCPRSWDSTTPQISLRRVDILSL